MPTATPIDLLRSLLDVCVLEKWQVEEASREVAPACEGDANRLVEELVRRGWLTAFQAHKLDQADPSQLLIGQYLLLDVLGEGGMGLVYKALHRRLNRLVALKTIREECLSKDSDAASRFQREARAAAQLNHPNIVTLYDFDQVEGVLFLAMEFVQGPELARLIKLHGPLAVDDASECIRQAALGLQHAFENGMVHRDLKPSNLLAMDPQASKRTGNLKRPGSDSDTGRISIAPSGKLPDGYVVKILDMGLVRMVDPQGERQTQLTQEGKLFGTPDYIAPEQARDARKADIRSDLYSLGCTYYYLLAGRPPFVGETVLETLMSHQLDEPPRLEELRPDVTPRVAAIVRKLMAKNPEARHATPADLVADLQALRPGSVAPATPLSVSGAAAKPTPTPLTISDPTPLPLNLTAARAPAKKIAEYREHRGPVLTMQFTSDRKQLASAGQDGSVRLWGFSRESPQKEKLGVPLGAEVHSVAIAPDRRLIAAGAGTNIGTIWLWDQRADVSKPTLSLHGHQAAVEALAFCPVGKLVGSGGGDRVVRVWDIGSARPRELSALEGHGDTVTVVIFSPDARLLASASRDGRLHLWGLGKLWYEPRDAFDAHTGEVLALQFSPDGRTLVTTGADQKVKFWDVRNGLVDRSSEAALSGHQAPVRSIQFSSDGRHVLSVDARGVVNLWDVSARRRLLDWELRFDSPTLCHAFTYDARYLATGLGDGSVFVHRLPFRELSL